MVNMIRTILHSIPQRTGSLILIFLWTGVMTAHVAATTRTITDMAEREVTIPSTIERVFADRFLSLAIFALDPHLLCNATFSVSPDARKYIAASYYAGKTLTDDEDEEILRLRPDVILIANLGEWSRDEADKRQRRLKIPVLVVDFAIASWVQTYAFLGRALNRPKASQRIVGWLNRYIVPLHEQAKTLPDDRRPGVYYAEGHAGLNTEPPGSFHSQVMDYLNVKNVADVKAGSIHGMSQASIEQIWIWNPEVILVWSGYPSGMGLPREQKKDHNTLQHIVSSPAWAHVKAVEAGRVYQIPSLPFGWFDRPPSTNCLPGVLWLAGILCPEIVTFDRNAALKEYYELFYHVRLMDGDLEIITEETDATI
jgi:iron complex transport system substrate-binding protein